MSAGKILQSIERMATPPRVKTVAGPILWMLGCCRRAGKFRLGECRRVLVIRLDAMGDLVMTSSCLRELRRNLPHAWIALVVDRRFASVVEKCPYIDELLPIDTGVPTMDGWLSRVARYFVFAARRLWGRKFDLALVPRWGEDYYNAVELAYLSGARWRVGYSESVNWLKEESNAGQDLLLTHPIVEREVRHEVEQNLGLLRHIGASVESSALEAWMDDDDRELAARILPDDGLAIAMCPGAANAEKVWPAENFAAIARWLANEYGARVVLLGGPREMAAASRIAARARPAAVDLTGLTTIRQAAAVIERCSLYVGNDTGPMHLAAALGVPVVEVSCQGISAALDLGHPPERFGPWGVANTVLRPERGRNIADVTVASVRSALSSMLGTVRAEAGSRR